MADVRASRLKALYNDVLKGEKSLTANNSKLFLEALCLQTPAVTIVPNLVASSHGLDALLLALSSDTSLPFLNGQLTSFLEYIRASDLQTICGGDVVRQVLSKLVEAPLTWKSFVKAARVQTLDQRALGAFAWLLTQLLSQPVEEALTYLTIAQDAAIQKALVDSSSYDIRVQGQRIVHIAETLAGGSTSKHTNSTLGLAGPGGRHDNDFADIQRISIHPTADELRTLDVYLPRACDVQDQAQDPEGLAIHIDSQFRLLREDMLRELREELAVSTQPKSRGRKPLVLNNLVLYGVHRNPRLPWSLLLICRGGLPQFHGLKAFERKRFLQDHPRFLRHGFLVCLFADEEFVTFGTLVREEELLIKPPNLICIQLPDTNVDKVLMHLKSACFNIRLLQIDTAIFSYEPVLKQLKETQELLLSPELVSWQTGSSISCPDYPFSICIQQLLKSLNDDYSHNLQSCLGLEVATRLDEAQAECFRAALEQRVVLIQGPPGTGKSFIGSLVAKAIHRSSLEKILVVCYTHHALDDFVNGLLDLGIPDHHIIRLGSAEKATTRTKTLALSEHRKEVKLTRMQFRRIQERKQCAANFGKVLRSAFFKLIKFKPSPREFLDFLEFNHFRDADSFYYYALQVPEDEFGMSRVDRRGKLVDKYYLVYRWIHGRDAGIFKSEIPLKYQEVWSLLPDERKQIYQEWCKTMIEEELEQIQETGKRYNTWVEKVGAVFLEQDLAVMQGKRIIACTTTAAAKYSEIIRSISPGVVLVEEAGEILEIHVLTALGPETKHLILIGDHKQLRPKVNYELSVEKGIGYDLNRSLFERLILKGFPHKTLFSQHRMRPEISALVREMTYPELEDAEETHDRPDLKGFSDNIIFVNHKEPESELSGGHELGDSRAYSSKQNSFEAKMTLKCIRYLYQQGYSADDIVVLTPYLGQLRLLHDELKSDNDPILNDHDSRDLFRAGLMPERAEEVKKPGLRISTIDNFQGEEANIVVASLTRSNIDNKIGWMSAPERLNVLISRARNALILIGNAEHFMGAPKGGDLWKRFFRLLKAGRHIYSGFPICCQRHPDQTAILQNPGDFDAKCPDGGCGKPCNKTLLCGIHKCPGRCHLDSYHNKVKCEALVLVECHKGHRISCECNEKRSIECSTCESEAKKKREEFMRKMKIQQEENENVKKLVEITRQIEAIGIDATEERGIAPQKTEPVPLTGNDFATGKSATASKNTLSDPKVDVGSASNKTVDKLKPAQCFDLLCRLLRKSNLEVLADDILTKNLWRYMIFKKFSDLLELSSCNNEKIVHMLAEKIVCAFKKTGKSITSVKVSAEDIYYPLNKMLAEQKACSQPMPSTGSASNQAVEEPSKPRLAWLSEQRARILPKTVTAETLSSSDKHSTNSPLTIMMSDGQSARSQPLASTGTALKITLKDDPIPQFTNERLADKKACSLQKDFTVSFLKTAEMESAEQIHSFTKPPEQEEHSQSRIRQMDIDALTKSVAQLNISLRSANLPNQSATSTKSVAHFGMLLRSANMPNRSFALTKPVTQSSTSLRSSNMSIPRASSSKVETPVPKTEPVSGQALDFLAEKTQRVDRDPGVSDQVWQQLQLDVEAQRKRREELRAKIQGKEEDLRQAVDALRQNDTKTTLILDKKKSIQTLAVNSPERCVKLPLLEQKLQLAGRNGVKLKEARDIVKVYLRTLQKAAPDEFSREREVQKKLECLGVCISKYRWIKQSGGYRCAGGSHFISNEVLRL